MRNRAKYLLNNYYDIDNNVKENYIKYKQSKLQENSLEYADSILLLMRCELLMGKYDFINKFDEILEIYQSHNDKVGEFFLLTTYGLFCRERKNTPKATHILSKAHELGFELNNFNLIVSSLINLICIDLKNETSAEVLEVFTNAEKYVKKIDHAKIIGAYNLNYGYLLFTNGKTKEAMHYYRKALKAYIKFYDNENTSNILTVKLNIAEAYLTLKNYQQAIKLYTEVYNISINIEDHSLTRKSLSGLVKSCEKADDYKNAFNYLKLVNEKLILLSQNDNSKETSNKLNDYLSAELEETKEKMLLYNLELKEKTLELENNLRQLNLISKVGIQLAEATNEDNLCGAISNLIYNNIKVDSVCVMLVNEDEKTIHTKYFTEKGVQLVTASTNTFSNRCSFSAYCAREKQDILINDIEKEAKSYIDVEGLEYKRTNEQSFFRSRIYCQATTENELIGIVNIQSKEKNAFDKTTFKTIKTIAYYVAVALSNATKSNLLKKLSYYDELTGLKNRRSFMETVNYIIDNFDKYNNIALIVADMNHLKKINDNSSHLEGDKYLVEIAKILKKVYKKSKVYRLSGDEFAIIINNTSEDEIILSIEETKLYCKNKNYQPYPLSLAMGYAYSAEKINLNKLFIEAETTMYKDKEKYYKDNEMIRR